MVINTYFFMLICEEIGYIASIAPSNFEKTALKRERERGQGYRIRAENALIVARVFWKTGARSFSLWRENFLFLEPKRKSLRATFFGGADTEKSVREWTGYNEVCLIALYEPLTRDQDSRSKSVFQVFHLANREGIISSFGVLGKWAIRGGSIISSYEEILRSWDNVSETRIEPIMNKRLIPRWRFLHGTLSDCDRKGVGY